jgi:phage portal protein BeeE
LYAADVVASGGVPHTVLQTQRRLTADQAAELQAQWVSRAQVRGGAPAVIPPVVVFTQLAWSPADLALLDSRRFDSVMICGAFGVPPPLVGVPIPQGGLTYTSTTDLL